MKARHVSCSAPLKTPTFKYQKIVAATVTGGEIDTKMQFAAALPSFSTTNKPVLNITTSFTPSKIIKPKPYFLLLKARPNGVAFTPTNKKNQRSVSIIAYRRKFLSSTTAAASGGGGSVSDSDGNVRRILQSVLWIAEGIYVIWLFLLPYAPGDPVWAISKETIDSLIGLSLNFFFILPLSNSVGFHLIEAPVLHPISEGLFNFVIGWTLMFAPLLYTDVKRDKYKGSIDLLWGFQMFLTNTFLIPYMAIRLNEDDSKNTPRKTSQLGLVMTDGAPIVGLVGGLVCLFSIIWAIYGRGDGGYGDLAERWKFLESYLGSERLAYAFIWDICFYIVFQPWLIGDNLQNIQKDKVGVVSFLRFVPVIGLITYCLCLDADNEM